MTEASLRFHCPRCDEYLTCDLDVSAIRTVDNEITCENCGNRIHIEIDIMGDEVNETQNQS